MLTSAPRILRLTSAWCAMAAGLAMLSACSSELASFDDTYVPQSVEENYPISVVEKPVVLKIGAGRSGLRQADADEVIQLASKAVTGATSPLSISYARGSAIGRRGAEQAVTLARRQGVARENIILTQRSGQDNDVTISVLLRMAETKPCGDWSQNLRGNQFNGSGPNFGCAVQQNMAVLVSDPRDLQRPRPITPLPSASQGNALDSYGTGAWTAPVVSPDSASSQ